MRHLVMRSAMHAGEAARTTRRTIYAADIKELLPKLMKIQ
jgi:hypothetical protein